MGWFSDIGDAITDNPVSDAISSAHDVVLQPLGIAESEASKAARRNKPALDQLLANLPNIPDADLARYAAIADVPETELRKLKEDPQLRNAQISALQKLGDITAGNGLTSGDRARIQQIGSEENIRERGNREAILQNARARGVGGSGLELASLLGSQQGSASRTNARDLGVEQLAQQRALDAIQAQGNLAGGIRGQEYSQFQNQATAQDAINKFNFANKQNIANSNVDLENQQRNLNNYVLPGQRFSQQEYAYNRTTGADQATAAAKDARNSQLLGLGANIAAGVATGGASTAAQGVARMSGTPTGSTPQVQYPGLGDENKAFSNSISSNPLLNKFVTR